MPDTDWKLHVRIISPSGVIDQSYLDKAAAIIRSHNMLLSEGKYAREVYGRFAGTDTQRLADLQAAMDDESVDVILCSRGGYGLCRIIDQLQTDGIIRHPKLLVGFSDITILHNLLTQSGISSVHGIMAKQIAELPETDISSSGLFSILRGEKPLYKISSDIHNRKGSATGILTGGNLSVLIGMRGTPFDFNPENSILFLEDIGEKPYHIDRMLRNLKLGGVFDKISGLIIGHFTDCPDDESMQQDLKSMVSGIVSPYDFPVCFGFPSGHEDLNYPLIMGSKVELIVDDKNTILRFC